MKKTNGRFRSNGGNNNSHSSQVFSLNYRFDSNSIAGKFNGTALDLIKKYNELAKDALNSSDVVTAEVFRQYAEHYRKIVTDINEKKNSNQNNPNYRQNNNRRDNENFAPEASENTSSEENLQKEETIPANLEANSDESVSVNASEKSEHREPSESRAKITTRRAFKVIEVKEKDKNSVEKSDVSEDATSEETTSAKPKRIYKKKF